MKTLRTFIAVLVCALLAAALPGESHAVVIAAMMSSDQPRYREAHRAFVKAMAGRGYKSTDSEIYLQSPNPDQISWSNTVRKFNAYRPDLMVVYGASGAMTAVRESDGIPVISVDVVTADQPAKGMCGVSSRVPMVTLLRTVQGIRPYSRIGVLYSTREVGSQRQLDDLRKVSAQFGAKLVEANVASAAGVDHALATLLDKAEVIVVTEGSHACRQFDKIVSKARARNIPVISTMPDAADKGALISLEINPQEQGYLAAEMAVRILEGAKPEHLSMLSPKRIDLVLNMRLAREMGIEIPFSVLGAATRFIK